MTSRPAPQPTQLNVQDLNPEQLASVKEQLDQKSNVLFPSKNTPGISPSSLASHERGKIALMSNALRTRDTSLHITAQEIMHLNTSFAQLRTAMAKFTSGIEAIDELKAGADKGEDSSVLVPLTASLYVPGRLKDRSRVMLDVGTGYMIEQPAQSARRCLNQKVLALGVNLDQLQATIETKQENLALVTELIRIKTISAPQSASAMTQQTD